MIEWISTFLPNIGPFVAGVSGMLITWFLMPAIIAVSYIKHLVDEPSGIRKLHSDRTPNLGGVAFYFSLLTIFFISGYAGQAWTPYLFAGLTILFFSGVKDDILVLSAHKKLILQIISVLLLAGGGDVVITNLGGVFGFNEIPYWAGLLLTSFTMIVVVNAYNLIDGIDGLAGAIGLVACLFFGSWFWSVGYMAQSILSFVCAGSLIGFLWYNFHPASIFMGDTGSQVMGFMLAFFAVSFVKIGITATAPVPFQNEIPVLVLSVLIVPLYDTLRVFTLRIFRKSSPFKADRLHVHHQLLDVGFSDKAACFIITSLNLAVLGFTLLFGALNVNLLLAMVLGSSMILFPTMGFKRFLLQKIGIPLPSARKIRMLEQKYGFNREAIEKETYSKTHKQEQDWEKVAV